MEQPDEAVGGVGDGERTPLTPTRSAPVYSGQKAAAAAPAQDGPTERCAKPLITYRDDRLIHGPQVARIF